MRNLVRVGVVFTAFILVSAGLATSKAEGQTGSFWEERYEVGTLDRYGLAKWGDYKNCSPSDLAGLKLLRSGKWSDALAHFQGLIKKKPDDLFAYRGILDAARPLRKLGPILSEWGKVIDGYRFRGKGEAPVALSAAYCLGTVISRLDGSTLGSSGAYWTGAVGVLKNAQKMSDECALSAVTGLWSDLSIPRSLGEKQVKKHPGFWQMRVSLMGLYATGTAAMWRGGKEVPVPENEMDNPGLAFAHADIVLAAKPELNPVRLRAGVLAKRLGKNASARKHLKEYLRRESVDTVGIERAKKLLASLG